jgi:hypothetical protein
MLMSSMEELLDSIDTMDSLDMLDSIDESSTSLPLHTAIAPYPLPSALDSTCSGDDECFQPALSSASSSSSSASMHDALHAIDIAAPAADEAAAFAERLMAGGGSMVATHSLDSHDLTGGDNYYGNDEPPQQDMVPRLGT